MYSESGTGNGGNAGSFNNTNVIGRRVALEKIKTAERILAAVYTLISAVLTIIKFVKQVDKMNNEAA